MAKAQSAAAARDAATQIVRTLREAGHTAFFAGGCVRDELLGLEPTDYDVATDARPERVQSLFRHSNAVGKCFGVIIVAIGKEVIEVATFRSDGDYSDARRPDRVTFSSPREDAARRDFTVNALFLDPLAAATGPASADHLPATAVDVARGTHPGPRRVIDLVGGLADLERRVIRAVGDADQRLQEDHLRALRAVRLSAKLGFEIEAATAAAITRHAADLRGVSRERIGDEVRRMLLHPTRAAAAATIHRLGLEASVLLGAEDLQPGAAALAGLPADAPLAAAMAAWALDLGGRPGDADAIADRWRRALCLSNEETQDLRRALAAVEVVETIWAGLGVAARKRAAASACFDAGLAVATARDAGRGAAVARDIVELAADGVGLAPAPLLTGNDLIGMGMKPGPVFKEILDRVYDAQLEGRVASFEAARELAAGRGV